MRDSQKNIVKLILSVTLLAVTGFLVYNNYFSKDKYFHSLPEVVSEDYLYKKFDFDIFDEPIFKSLVKAKLLTRPAEDEVGKENPFLHY